MRYVNLHTCVYPYVYCMSPQVKGIDYVKDLETLQSQAEEDEQRERMARELKGNQKRAVF